MNLRLRGVAVGLATFINRLTSGVIALSFLSLQVGLASGACRENMMKVTHAIDCWRACRLP